MAGGKLHRCLIHRPRHLAQGPPSLLRRPGAEVDGFRGGKATLSHFFSGPRALDGGGGAEHGLSLATEAIDAAVAKDRDRRPLLRCSLQRAVATPGTATGAVGGLSWRR